MSTATVVAASAAAFSVSDVRPIAGIGVGAHGRLTKGEFAVGDAVDVLKPSGALHPGTVYSVEGAGPGQPLKVGQRGLIIVQNVSAASLRKGDVVVKGAPTE
jgi:translation elongation factor EF-1alpha